MTVLMDGVVFGESPRWHDGRREPDGSLVRRWSSQWGGPAESGPTGQVVAFPAPAPGAGRP